MSERKNEIMDVMREVWNGLPQPAPGTMFTANVMREIRLESAATEDPVTMMLPLTWKAAYITAGLAVCLLVVCLMSGAMDGVQLDWLMQDQGNLSLLRGAL